MRNINVPIEDDRHNDLKLIQEYYSKEVGTKLSQTQTLQRLLFESANMIRSTEKLRKESCEDK